ncbi:MAG: ATP-binding protein [Anaerolineae bacterium]|nr:ATP-binding protein [Anaerolineae bacterium]
MVKAMESVSEEPTLNIADHYSTSLQHILAELERIDLLIRIQVWRARHVSETDEGFHGLYISNPEIDALIAAPAGLPQWATAPTPLSLNEVQTALDQVATSIAQHKTASTRQGITLRLDDLKHLFDLTSFEIDVLLICLAPELDLRYERLYAYLQDDVTKKRPSVDLVLNLLSPSFEAKLAARSRFTPSAPLLNHRLLVMFDDPSDQQPPLLGKYLKLDERIVNYLLDSDELDARLLPYVRHTMPQIHLDALLLPTDVKERLALLSREIEPVADCLIHRAASLVFYFQGPYGVGKRTTAEALCRELGTGLLLVKGEQLLEAAELPFETAVKLLAREALLQNAALYWTGFDALLTDHREAWQAVLLAMLESRSGLTFLVGQTTWEPRNALHTQRFVRVEFPRPTAVERLQLWALALNSHTPQAAEVELGAVASKFRFSGGQIQDAAATARNLACWRDPENGRLSDADLYAACRLQSNRKLAMLTHKVTPHYTWDDIVLPPDRLEQLREICNTVKYRVRVYDEWGFDRKLSLGKGLNILFAGPSGTGKTMGAEIMANELDLDLYKIDLSTVVSKYIGETEKNLARIFEEAETSNAILFFDEADALFGKRSEVRDAHDRYANIEISYLLQKMEEYEGMTILTTNLHKNMDDAFVRRMHFTVDFPFPGEPDRRRIWDKIWPQETPGTAELDLAFMARQFELTGGNIRNVALAAAFLAADDGTADSCDREENGHKVTMEHLIHATWREYQKIGKVVGEEDFGEYADKVMRKA